MKSFLLVTLGGTLLIITKYSSIKQPDLLKKLAVLGKFIAYEIPIDAIKANYSAHFEHLTNAPSLQDEFKVLDTETQRIFLNVDFETLGPMEYFQPDEGNILT